MSETTNRSRMRSLMFIVVALLVVTAACTTSSEDAGFEVSSDAGATTTMAAVAAPGEAPAAGDEDRTVEAPDALGTGAVVPAVLQVRDLGRDIIFTAQMTVAVNDVAAASAEATRVIESLGGIVFGQQTTGTPEPRAVLTFKVFPEHFQEALDRLGSIGELRTQTVSADDVTERVVDLESRINTATASVERLRGFLADATDIKTIAELENQLLQRETELETLRGQLRTVQDLVSLATITVTLTQAESSPAVDLFLSAYPGHEDAGASCPGEMDIDIEESTDVTLCFEVFNTGDTNLTDFGIRDAVLGIESVDELIVVFGDPKAVLEPGQSFLLAAELTPERSVRSQTRLTATAVTASGDVVDGRSVATTMSIFVQTFDPGGLPGFSDGLDASWNLLQNLGGLVVLFAGIALPFLWVLLAAWLFIRWRRGRDPEPTPPPVMSEG